MLDGTPRSPSALAKAQIALGTPSHTVPPGYRSPTDSGYYGSVTPSSASPLPGRGGTSLPSRSSVSPISASVSMRGVADPQHLGAGASHQDHLIRKQMEVEELNTTVHSLRKKLSSTEQSIAHYMEMHRLAEDRAAHMAQENNRLKTELEISTRTKAMTINNLEHSVSATIKESDDQLLAMQRGLAEQLAESEKLRVSLRERTLQVESSNAEAAHTAQEINRLKQESNRLKQENNRVEQESSRLEQENKRLKNELEISTRTKAITINNLEHSVSATIKEANDELLALQRGLVERLAESEKIRDGLCERMMQLEYSIDEVNERLRVSNNLLRSEQVAKFVLFEAMQRSALSVQASDALAGLLQQRHRMELSHAASVAAQDAAVLTREKEEATLAFKELTAMVAQDTANRAARHPSPKTHRGTNPDNARSTKTHQEQQTQPNRMRDAATTTPPRHRVQETSAMVATSPRRPESPVRLTRPAMTNLSPTVASTVSRIQQNTEFSSASAAEEVHSWKEYAEGLKMDLEKERAAGDRLRDALEAVHQLDDPTQHASPSVALIVRDGELASMRQRLDEAVKRNDISQAAEAKLRFQLKESSEECGKLNEESSVLHNAIRKLQLEVRTEKRHRTSERDETQESVADAAAKLNSQESELIALRTQVTRLTSVETQLEGDLNHAVAKADELQHKVDVLGKEPRCGQACRTLKLSLNSAHSELDATNSTVTLLQKRLREVEKASASVTLFEEERKALEGTLEERAKRNEILEGRVSSMSLTNNAVNLELTQLSQENSELKLESTKYKLEADSLRHVAGSAEAQSQSLHKEVEQLKPMLAEAQQRLIALPAPSVIAAEAGAQAVESLQIKVSGAAEQLVHAASEIEALSSENDELRGLLHRYQEWEQSNAARGHSVAAAPQAVAPTPQAYPFKEVAEDASFLTPGTRMPGHTTATSTKSKSPRRAHLGPVGSAHGSSGQTHPVPQLSSSHLPGTPSIDHHSGGLTSVPRSISSRQF